jgi:Tol biopolymer transport system component
VPRSREPEIRGGVRDPYATSIRAKEKTLATQTRFGATGWEAYGGQWLPDGSGLVVSADKWGETEGGQLFYVSHPDGRYRRITNDSNQYFGLDVTADGMTIAAVRSVRVANVWSIPVEGKARPKQLTFNATSDTAIANFVVTPDGAIVFTAPTDQHAHVWTTGADGQNSRQLTLGTNDEAILRTLPNGELVVYQMGEDHTPHIGLVDRDGGNPRPLARGTGEWLQDISPDGKALLFMRAENLHELWSVPVAGGEPRKVATSYNYTVVVSPDSRTVAYLTPQELEGASPTTCIVAPIEGGAPTSPTAPAESSTHSNTRASDSKNWSATSNARSGSLGKSRSRLVSTMC